ncbi:hypothetical protein [Pseudomonas prosekii]|uniref:hypothetical protein n=1 Tax=Pseudomonas prosekii TaxID=1148509 RepID=UPI00387B22B1
MIEFNNRIDAQRAILGLINQRHWEEELFGLSSGAIDRWIRANDIDPAAELSRAVYEAAGKLFFLANKSQEQVTEEYQLLSGEIHELTRRIARLISI